jgi:hypothetical protein
MKNPFEKDNNKTIILAGAVVSLALAGAAFLFFSDKGKRTRKGLKKKLKGIAKDAAVNAISKKAKLNKKTVKAVADQVLK